jgi:hypothetical protein
MNARSVIGPLSPIFALALIALTGPASPTSAAPRSDGAAAVTEPASSTPATCEGQDASVSSPAVAADSDTSQTPQEAAKEKAAEDGKQSAAQQADTQDKGEKAAAPPTANAGDGVSRFSDQPIPLAKVPKRPHPVLEIGPPFLGTGTLPKGFTLPGGATWQPSFLTWGTLRSAINDEELGGGNRRAAWVNRADFFGQLNLTPTERVIASFRPLDQDGQFTGVTFSPQRQTENGRFNGNVRTLYFEGDFGEMFPDLDPTDRHALDYGLAVGRMPVFFEEGMLINDAVDAVGVVRNALHPSASASNLRLTTIFGWGNVNRGGNDVEDRSAKLAGLFSEFDIPTSTVDIDVIYVNADSRTGSGLYGGISSVQRLWGWLNTTFRVLGSYALDQQTASVASGALLYSAISWTPEGTDDIAYIDTYGAINNYTPAARDAGLGGPLTNVGILYEGVGLGGSYGNVLPNVANRSFGGAIGYQKFFNRTRTQIIFELGARKGTASQDKKAEAALAVRFQQAIGSHLIARVEGFAHAKEAIHTQYGARYEFFLKF